jgi:serine/threonine protein phosphatase 1
VLKRFEINPKGRDFVVGDIHGMFSHLRALLAGVNFDGTQDRLFSVGDLIDRGPDSHEATRWLAYPWFHSVRGNHEQFALDSDDPEQLDLWVRYNGGAWWKGLSTEDRLLTRDIFSRLPLVMEVNTDDGTIGIVHADVPPMVTWDRFVELLGQGDEDAVFCAMWSRCRIQGNFANTNVPGSVERVYCGHTPIREVLSFGNVHFIDTGAVYSMEGYANARLSMIEIQPGPHRVHDINTNLHT